MTIQRTRLHASTLTLFALISLVLVLPGRALATGGSDSIERWNIAMTDFSAGLPPPGLQPFVEARVYAMVHIAVLDAVKTATRAPNLGFANVDAAVAEAAHDVLIPQLGLFFGSNLPFDKT